MAINNASTLLSLCPGTTGDLARAIDAVFRVTDPALALSVAFSVAGAVRAGRLKYKWCHANAYHCVVGLTGIGKTIAQNCGIQTIVEAELSDLLCGDFTSESALIHRLITNPITYAMFDEIGLALQNMAEDRGGNRREVFACILRAYSAANGVLLGKHYSPRTGASTQMSAPAPLLSIFGSSTPSAFFAGMTSRAAADGLLGRFFLWFAGNSDSKAKERDRREFAVPDSVQAEYTEFKAWQAGLLRPTTKEIIIESRALFDLILEEWERQIRLEKNENRRALIARAPELFIKLCIALTDSRCTVSTHAITFAQELLTALYADAWLSCEDALGRGKFADERLQVSEKFLAKIPFGSENKITKSELHRRTRRLGLRSFDRKDLLQELIESAQVTEFEAHDDDHTNVKTTYYYRNLAMYQS